MQNSKCPVNNVLYVIGPGGEWQTGATGDTGGVEWAVCQTRAES